MSITDIARGFKVAIYKIDTPSGKVYIGQSRNLVKRFNAYNTANCKNQQHLRNSLLKYGVNKHVFSIVQEFSEDISIEDLDRMELEVINRFIDCGYSTLNIREPGYRGGVIAQNKHLLKIKKPYPPRTKEHLNKQAESMRKRWVLSRDTSFSNVTNWHKYTPQDIQDIKKNLNSGLSRKEIASKLGITPPALRSILTNRLPEFVKKRVSKDLEKSPGNRGHGDL